MKSTITALVLLSLYQAVSATANPTPDANSHAIEKRAGFEDSYNIYIRKRNAHACMMSTAFIVVFPLGAISQHLPLSTVTTHVTTLIHLPIQLLGLILVISALGLGLDLSLNDLHFLGPHHLPLQTHVVFGLIIVSSLILFQPTLGLIQHYYYFRRTGKSSVLSLIHRWFGRVIIICGWINAGLGFQLVGYEFVPQSVKVREWVILGVMGGIWWGVVIVDAVRSKWLKKDKMGAWGVSWSRRRDGKGGLRLVKKGGEMEEGDEREK